MSEAMSLLRSGNLLESESGNFYYMNDENEIMCASDGDVYSRNYRKVSELPVGKYSVVEE